MSISRLNVDGVLGLSHLSSLVLLQWVHKCFVKIVYRIFEAAQPTTRQRSPLRVFTVAPFRFDVGDERIGPSLRFQSGGRGSRYGESLTSFLVLDMLRKMIPNGPQMRHLNC